MASFKPKKIISILSKLGYKKKRQSGSHIIMFHPISKITIPVPMHSRDVKRGLLLGIIKRVNSTEKEFIKLK